MYKADEKKSAHWKKNFEFLLKNTSSAHWKKYEYPLKKKN